VARAEYQRKRWFEGDRPARDQHLRRKFGITLSDYQAMNAAQNGLCAICGKTNGKKELLVDHNHETRQVRQLLCTGCNVSLGNFKEDIGRMEQAIAYLRKHNEIRLAPFTFVA
jgi:hypothetical protein